VGPEMLRERKNTGTSSLGENIGRPWRLLLGLHEKSG